MVASFLDKKNNVQMRDFVEILEIIRKKVSQNVGLEKISDAQVADALGVGQSRIATWKCRGTIPFEVLFAFCKKNNILLDNLLSNEKSIENKIFYNDCGVCNTAVMQEIDLDALRTCIKVVENFLTNRNYEINSDIKAEIIAVCYEEIMESEAGELPDARIGRFLKLKSS